MARGDGSITPYVRNGQAVKGCWRVCVSFGVDRNGKRKKIQRIVHGSKTQARIVRDQIKQQYESICFDKKETLFSDYVETWEASLRTSGITEETIKGYLTKLEHMNKYIGNMRLIEIRPDDIEAALAELRTQKKLGGTSLNKVFSYTKRVFDLAVARDVILRNPCCKIKAPKIDTSECNYLSEQEIVSFYKLLNEKEEDYWKMFDNKEDRVRARAADATGCRSCVRGLSQLSSIIALRIALSTGMRRGELCGLLWDSVDLENLTITVRRSLTSRMVLKIPKTRAGERTISIDDGDLPARLSEWKSKQRFILETIYGANSEKMRRFESVPVCCNDKGELYDPTNLQRWWKRFRESTGIVADLHLHELRHTQATQLLGNGIDVQTVAARLGHKKATSILSTYSHVIPKNDQLAASVIGGLICKDRSA